jgi:hypothetical protein
VIDSEVAGQRDPKALAQLARPVFEAQTRSAFLAFRPAC